MELDFYKQEMLCYVVIHSISSSFLSNKHTVIVEPRVRGCMRNVISDTFFQKNMDNSVFILHVGHDNRRTFKIWKRNNLDDSHYARKSALWGRRFT